MLVLESFNACFLPTYLLLTKLDYSNCFWDFFPLHLSSVVWGSDVSTGLGVEQPTFTASPDIYLDFLEAEAYGKGRP